MNQNFNSAGSIDYGDALSKSILFYEAQQSGKLTNNRVPWRKDSALSDGTDVGRDLSGGYYDAADYVKFGFPMASAMTMLSWGAIQYRSAYEQSGQLDEIMATIKHATEYIKKAHVVVNGKTTAFWGQVGDGDIDHSYWTSPEIIDSLTKNPIPGISPFQKMDRPSSKIDATHPGSDLAGESAATLAAASILFRPTDAAYADDLLTKAKQLFAFAKDADGNPANGEQRGNYSAPGGLYNPNKPNSPNPAHKFYPSKAQGDTSPDIGYEDELGWGSIWLYKATKAAGAADLNYFNQAKQYYQSKYLWEGAQSWMEKSYGGMVLMAQEDTTSPHYKSQIENTWLKEWTLDDRQAPTGTVKYTPSGLAWLDGWGALRYTANTAFIAGVYADTINDPNKKYSDFAQSQIEYILGKNPTSLSYMVGFGDKYPQRVHHRAASGLTNYGNNPGQAGQNIDNINDIIGGLVGGPTTPADSSYSDVRLGDDLNGQPAYKGNEVALDYNAGFTGALARLYGINNPMLNSATRNDFNGDRKADILWNSTAGTVALWQMNGSTVTTANLTSTSYVNPSWKTAGTGDFNGDGKADILWRNDDGRVALWQMNGAIVTASSLTSTPTLPSSWKTAGTGDYNGDGKSDLLWRNDNGAVAVWQMNGATVTASSLTSTPTLSSSWKVAGNSDFDGDGKTDILWRNDDGSVALWQMNGAAITASTAVAQVATDWKIAGTGDFNGDSKADILWRNDDGRVALWQMNGAAITSSSLTSTPARDSSQTVAGINDYNGDGKADILWRKDTGALEVWQMNGSAVVSSTPTSVAADGSNWKIAAPII